MPEGAVTSCCQWLIYFVNNTSYASLLATKLEKLLVNDKITVLVNRRIHLPSIISNVTNNKNELFWKSVWLTSLQKSQLQHASVFFKFVHLCFLLYVFAVLFKLPFLRFEGLFLWFTQFCDSFHCLKFDKFRVTRLLYFNVCWFYVRTVFS